MDNTDITAPASMQPRGINQAYEVLSQSATVSQWPRPLGAFMACTSPEAWNLLRRFSNHKNFSGKARPDGQAGHFVFHGGSGSSREQIRGRWVWSRKDELGPVCSGRFGREFTNSTAKTRLPAGAAREPGRRRKAKQKYYDPRAWLRSGEQSFVDRLVRSFEDLNCMNRNAG